MLGNSRLLPIFLNSVNEFNKTRALMLDPLYIPEEMSPDIERTSKVYI